MNLNFELWTLTHYFFGIKKKIVLFSSVLFLCLLSGCTLFNKDSELSETRETVSPLDTQPQPYTVKIQADQTEQEKKECDVADSMKKHSRLIQLHDKLPDGMLGLEGRVRSDKNNAVDLMRSLGYYDGTVDATIIPPKDIAPEDQKEKNDSAEVVLNLVPRTRYHVGNIDITYTRDSEIIEDNIRKNDRQNNKPLPDSELINLGLPVTLDSINTDSPAIADNILSVVDTLKAKLSEKGFPEAKIAKTRYTLNKDLKQLNIHVFIELGHLSSMGEVNVIGATGVSEDYIKKLATWKKGDKWDQKKIDRYRENLQKTGLFRSIEITPGKSSTIKKSKGRNYLLLPVNVTVKEGAFRSLSLSLRYATDTGVGVNGSWTHKNLFGSGEKFSITTPFAQDLRGVITEFEKPFFGEKERKLIMGASYLKEETDAYTKNAGNAYAGIEQSFWESWKVSAKLFAEAGNLTKQSKLDYHYESIMSSLEWDTRNSTIDPKSGINFRCDIIPIFGNYDGSFFALSSKVALAAYYPLLEDKVTLAGKVSMGSIFGADLKNIPPPLRFYSGGAGSVRGYAKQKIGPRDLSGDPLGGLSFNEINLEARIHITEKIGLVPFIDGGMIYEEEVPKFFTDLRWAAGLGIRYYTAIGPIRLDVAFPLNKTSDDKGYQIYFSIGQAF